MPKPAGGGTIEEKMCSRWNSNTDLILELAHIAVLYTKSTQKALQETPCEELNNLKLRQMPLSFIK